MWKNAISSVCLMMMLPSFAWATGGPQLVQNGATELGQPNQPGDPALHHGIEFTEGIEHEVDLTGLTTGEALTVQGLTDHELDHPHLIRPMSGSSTGITITGRIFYEDHRDEGQFHRRYDPMGNEGVKADHRSSDLEWLLGAYYMVVDVYERDDTTLGLLSSNCSLRDHMGSAMVQRDGSFSLTFSTNDACDWDAWSTPRFSIRVRTRFCSDDVCFQVGPGSNDYYELWYADDAPFSVSSGSTYDVGSLVFTNESEGEKNDWARAANQYASIVDAIATVHNEEGIPFRQGTYGGLQVRYPSIWADGRATDYDLIDLDNRGWPGGGKAMHEYGHIVHRRAWGGDYAGHHDPIQEWSSASVESPFIAMKEGWANFIQRYVSGKCFKPSYDDNHDFQSLTSEHNGRRFPDNHHRMLCDWVDDRDDQRDGVTGVGDVFTATLWSLWHNLDETDETISAYGGNDPVDPGLGMCDMVGYYLEVRKSEDEVGSTAHDQYVWWIASLLENNDISCPDVPDTEDLRAYDYGVTLTPVAVDDSGVDAAGDGIRVVTLEVEVDNSHPFIEAEGGRIQVSNRTASQLLTWHDVPTLGARDHITYTVDTEVEMVGGEPISTHIRATMLDRDGYDEDASNDVANLILDSTTLRPNLTPSVSAIVPEGTLPETLTITIDVENDGLTDAVLERQSGRMLRTTKVTITDTFGELLVTRFLRGQLAAGDARQLSVDVPLSDELRASSVSHLIVRVDARDMVAELNERDNVATLVLRGIDYVDFPELDNVTDLRSELVESSMWIEDLQHDMFEDAMSSFYPWWMYQSPVDRAFSAQLQEMPTYMTERVWGERMPSEVSVGLELDVMPRTRQVGAAQQAQRWRWLP